MTCFLFIVEKIDQKTKEMFMSEGKHGDLLIKYDDYPHYYDLYVLYKYKNDIKLIKTYKSIIPIEITNLLKTPFDFYYQFMKDSAECEPYISIE